jgi:DNA polymerase I-like protein with 3'-5' exonuclease and polymerase domains/uracil-DNA glycosylase
MIVSDFPGETEMLKGEPLLGYAGMEFNKMLSEAGIMRGMCFVTTFLRQRPPGNEIESFIALKKSDATRDHVSVRDKQALPIVRDSIALLAREIEMCRPNVIIALGNAAMWGLTGKWGITSWRGSVLQTDLASGLDYQPKVIPVYSPSMIFRNWSWRKIAVHDIRRAVKESKTPGISPPDYKFLIHPDYSQILAILHRLQTEVSRRPLKLSVDLETVAGHIEMIGLAWSKTEALAIPLMKEGDPNGYWTDEEEGEIAWQLYRLLTHQNIEVIGQNFSYDAQYFYRHHHYIPRLKRDTMLAQHSMFSSMQKSLDFLASLWCEHYVYWKDELHGDPTIRQTYNCKDCCITYEVDEAQQPAVDQMGLRAVHDFQQALFYPVLETMLKGIRPDTTRRSRFAMELFNEIQIRENWLLDVLGETINIKSPVQMKELFYDTLGQKQVIGRKTGNASCDDEALRTIAHREPILLPLTRKISELRSLGVFLSTFVNAPLDSDGRIRCSFNIAGTETYRFSSSQNAFGSGLNLQNIPKGGEAGDGLELPNVRDLFIPDQGRTFFDIDLSSADLRIVVWESDCKEMKALLKAGLDPYTEIAKEFYHDPSISKKDPRRQIFKSFAHGTNYLGTAKGLAERLGLSVAEAEKTQKWYFGRFPEIKRWQDRVKDQVLKRGYVENVFGYKIFFFDRIEGTIYNQAVACIPQSTVACLINRAYVKIHQTMPEVDILLQVHDSLAGQFPTQKEDYYAKAIVDAAEIELPYAGDPLIIPVGLKMSRKSWGGCE